MSDSETDGYAGTATLMVDGRAVPVHAVLAARHEPQDGRLHWFGRLRATAPADVRFDEVGADAAVTLDAGAGAVTARLGDVDPWGRIRVTGVGPPPTRRVCRLDTVSLPFRHGESAVLTR